MNELTEIEKAWLAGIYEGEGSCAITSGRAIRVEIEMTDPDIIERVQALTGLGTVRSLAQRDEKYKPVFGWSIGSIDAVEFLEAILPWLGIRRSRRAAEAVENWKTNKRQSSRGDLECIHGHAYDAPGNRRNKQGVCHFCSLDASRRYREKKRATALNLSN